jgi:DNA-binding PadR family transcriptional regulator
MKSKTIRLTTTSYALLAVINEFGEMTSYDIKGEIEASIENFWPVPHTTAYEEPVRLAQAGYLSSRQEEGGRRRRLYSLTAKGREALAAWAAEPAAAAPQLRDEVLLKIFAGADPVPLHTPRLEFHRAKLAELERYLAAVRESGGMEASDRVLTLGIAYQRKMIELLEEFAPPAGA